MRYDYDSINAIHLELTSHCNLMCPQCARVKEGKLLPDLPPQHLPVSVVEKVFSEMGTQINYVHLCGNYGDFSIYPWGLEAIDLIQKNKDVFIKVYSNGSAGQVSFWEELGKKLSKKRGHVVFSLDGLADTNHLYRVGSNWDKILRNVRAFIGAGGSAVWEWLPFEHNDHQIAEATELAKELGFESIILKKNPRFSPLNNGEHHMLKPSQVLVHEGIRRVEQGFESTLLPIRCKYHARKMIYIDFQGYLLPCCWHGNRFKGKNKFNDLHQIFSVYGLESFDVSKKTIKEILQHDWYTTAMDYTIKILPTCRKHCTAGGKMSNKDNRVVHTFKEHYDFEPWEAGTGL